MIKFTKKVIGITLLIWQVLMFQQVNAQTLIESAGGTLTDLTPDGVTITSFGGVTWINNGLIELNGNLLFTARSATNGDEIWVSDGTLAGTTMLIDIASGADSSFVSNIIRVGSEIYFSANNGSNGNELWKTDGTAGGTQLIRDIYTGEQSANPTGLTEFNGKVLFSALDATSEGFERRNLWITDGTADGTVRLSSPTENGVEPIMSGDAVFRSYIQTTDSLAFFVGDDGITGRELWVTNGDVEPWGTHLVLDIDTTANTSEGAPEGATVSNNVQWLATANDKQVIFRARTPKAWTDGVASSATLGEEVWVTDGSAKGTYFLGDYATDADANNPEGSTVGAQYAYPVNYNGKVYFRAFKSVVTVEPGFTALNPGDMSLLTDLLSTWPDGNNYPSWIQRQAIFDDLLWFFGRSAGAEDDPPGRPRAGYELYKTDGTDLGTVIAADILPGTGSSWPSLPVEVNDRFYFAASDQGGQISHDIWAVHKKGSNDPTLPEGTNFSQLDDYLIYKVVNDIDGQGSAVPHDFIEFNGMLGFISISGKLMIYDDGIATKVARNESTDFGPSPTDFSNDLINGSPIVNITSPSAGSTFIENGDITIDLLVADDSRDTNGGISKVEYYDFGGSIESMTLLATDSEAPFGTFDWVNVSAGEYNILAIAYDNEDAFTYSSPVSIKVEGNILPTVTLTNPSEGQEFDEGEDIGLGVTAVDPDGQSVTKVEFFNGTNLIGESTVDPFSYLWEDVATGNYALSAKVYDANGGSGESSVINIVVNKVLGIRDDLPGRRPMLYPNPVSTTIELEWGSELNDNIVEFSILDISGSTMLRRGVNDVKDVQKIDVSNLNSGNYILILKDSKGRNGVIRFIKK